jgi:hypothetical protein
MDIAVIFSFAFVLGSTRLVSPLDPVVRMMCWFMFLLLLVLMLALCVVMAWKLWTWMMGASSRVQTRTREMQNLMVRRFCMFFTVDGCRTVGIEMFLQQCVQEGWIVNSSDLVMFESGGKTFCK